ncbi:hypothetical protein ACFL5L_03500, partial [candidate division KSB1 bacterium]
GFYTSQDADVSLTDNGSYYTWLLDEIEQHLEGIERDVFSRYYGISEMPDHIETAKDRNVLYMHTEIDKVAEALNISAENAENLRKSALEKLKAIRNSRVTPFIDKVIYTNVNGMMISAYIEAYRVLKREELKDFAIKSLDMIIEKLYSRGNGFAHKQGGMYGLLDDQVRMLQALIDGFSISQKIEYLSIAQQTVDYIERHFEDKESGGFYSFIPGNKSKNVISMAQKSFMDQPVSSENAVLARNTERLFALTGEQKYRDIARRTLEAMAAPSIENSPYFCSFGTSLQYYLNPPPQIVIIGNPNDSEVLEIYNTATGIHHAGKEVFIIDPESDGIEHISEVIAAKLAASDSKRPVAFVCTGTTCSLPVYTSEALLNTFEEFDW